MWTTSLLRTGAGSLKTASGSLWDTTPPFKWNLVICFKLSLVFFRKVGGKQKKKMISSESAIASVLQVKMMISQYNMAIWHWSTEYKHNQLNISTVIVNLTVFTIWLLKKFYWFEWATSTFSGLIFLYNDRCKKSMTAAIGNGFCAFCAHIIPQVVRSLNVTEMYCNLMSASNWFLRNAWNFIVLFAWRTIFFLVEVTKQQENH